MGIMKKLLGRERELSKEDPRQRERDEKLKRETQRRLQLLETEVRIMRREY